jgi:SAM-dependent methyltransferase
VSFQDHFSASAAIYAKARPTSPPELYALLASLAPGRELAWDCGTGNGQAALGLAAHFQSVVATEPSAAQLAEAFAHPRIVYRQGAELAVGVPDRLADLVTAACAAHWFDLGLFYPEVRRVLRPGGLVAIWNYRVCRVSPAIDPIIDRFYGETVGEFWPPERRMAETSYRDLHFPFAELPFQELTVRREWTLAELLAYVRTWSAVARYAKARGNDPVLSLETALVPVWGAGTKTVTWPLGGRIGRVG